MVAAVAVLRCTLKLRDGRVHSGYTPAFDPADGSVWLTATPDSPAGTMFTLERLRAIVLEPMEGRAIVMPTTTAYEDPGTPIHVVFADGEVLAARRKAVVPGIGTWVGPAGRPPAWAFVPAEAPERIAEADGGTGFELEWGFLPVAPSVPPRPSLSSLTLPLMSPARLSAAPTVPPPSPSSSITREIELPDAPLVAATSPPPASLSSSGEDATDAMPAITAEDLHQHTQPVPIPLVPPRAPSTAWPEDPSESNSSITTPDLRRPELDE